MTRLNKITDVIDFLFKWENLAYIMIAIDYPSYPYNKGKHTISSSRIEYPTYSRIEDKTTLYDCIDFEPSIIPELMKILDLDKIVVDKPNVGCIKYYTLNKMYVRTKKIEELNLD